MKAYVLSTENGTVQIGHAVYCIQTMESFTATRKGLAKTSWVDGLPEKRSYDVPDNSWRSAKIALEAHHGSLYGEPGSTLAQ